MPQVVPVSVVDRAATPKTHTFVPVDVDGGVAQLVERLATGSYIGEPKLVAGNRVTPTRRSKSDIKMVIPKVVDETINGVIVSKVIDTSYLTITCDWGQHFTETERQALLGLVTSASGTAAQQPFLNKVLVVSDRIYG